jgi:ribosomal protein S18 acetylase RimI-like enzyme
MTRYVEARRPDLDTSGVEVVMLEPGDESVLRNVAPDVFDLPVQEDLAAEFLADPRHHIAVAIDRGIVVGFASAVHYLHPDKPAELWINEVGVAATHRRRGLARRILHALLERGEDLGCREAWVLADRNNEPALRLYGSVGGLRAREDVLMFTFRIGEKRQPLW